MIAGAAYCIGCAKESWVIGQAGGGREMATGERVVCSENYRATRSERCLRPAPELDESNAGVWEIFQRCRRGRGVVFASAFGFDSVPRGIRPESARQIAAAADVPWTEEAVERFEYLEDCWIAEMDRNLAERRAQLDAEAEARRNSG